jgi:hypothetical protein
MVTFSSTIPSLPSCQTTSLPFHPHTSFIWHSTVPSHPNSTRHCHTRRTHTNAYSTFTQIIMKAPAAKVDRKAAPYAIPSNTLSRPQQRRRSNGLAPTAPAWHLRVHFNDGAETPELAFLEDRNIVDRTTVSLLSSQADTESPCLYCPILQESGFSQLPVRMPVALEPASGDAEQLWDIAQGENFGGNLTCFDDYQHLRHQLEEHYPDHMVKINAAFDKYRKKPTNAVRGDNEKAASSQAEKEKSIDHDEKENKALEWQSSIFADYLFFLCKLNP